MNAFRNARLFAITCAAALLGLVSIMPIAVRAQVVPTGVITARDTGSTVGTGQSGATVVTGAPSNNSTVSAPQGQFVNFAAITLGGAWTGTLEFDMSADGGNSWGTLSCQPNGAGGLITSATGNGIFSCLTAGATNIRVRSTAAMTGRATVVIAFLSSVGAVNPVGPVGVFDKSSGYALHVNSDGSININGSITATLGGFAGNGGYANLTATGSSSASTALPTGTSVRITNTGTTEVSCTFATGAATGARNNIQVAPSSSVSRVNGTFDHIACIDQGSADSTSNVVVLEGGSGLGNDSGGGGAGSGSGGAVTAISNAFVDGSIATIGTEADPAWVSGTGTLVALGKATVAALNQGVATSGASVPNNIIYLGGNRSGNLYGITVVNPSGSIEAGQVDLASIAGATIATGHGTAAGAIRVELPTDGTGVVTPLSTTNAGGTLVKGGVGVVNGGSGYNTIAASQSAQIMSATQGGGTGTTGDYLSHCILQPTTTAAGTMTIADNSTTIYTFTIGTLSNLASIPVPIGAVSIGGGWKVTTGANETVTCFGKFS